MRQRTFLRASDKAQSAGVLHLAVHARCSAAQVLIDQGRLHLAEQACRTAIDLAEGQRFPPLGVALSILGGIALERNDLASAEQLLNEGIALSRQGMLLDSRDCRYGVLCPFDSMPGQHGRILKRL